MSNRLAGKVGLISGAARGLGTADARAFIDEGAKVLLGDILDGEGQKLASELNEGVTPCRAAYVHLDVTQAASWENAVIIAEREFGRLDVLINNAGVLSMSGVEDTTEEEWQGIVDVNQKGVWLGMKAVIPAMRRAGGGSIVNISSLYGLIGSGGATAYQGTKGAVRIITKTAAVQYAAENIRVNSVHPGLINTPMAQLVPVEARKKLAAGACMNREGRPEEVAHGVVFLASDEASFVTGAELVIDGGYSAA